MKKMLKIWLFLLVIRWLIYCIALTGWSSGLASLSIVQMLAHTVTSFAFWPKLAKAGGIFYKVFGIPGLMIYVVLQIIQLIAVRGKPGAPVLPPPPAKHRIYVRIVDGNNERCVDIGNCHHQTIQDGLTLRYDAADDEVYAELAGGRRFRLHSTNWHDVGRFKLRVARYDGSKGASPQKARITKIVPYQIRFSVIKKEA